METDLITDSNKATPTHGESALVQPPIVRLRWDDPKWWPAHCPECGWQGMSNETAGGNQIADTGDYDDPVCPVCIAPEGNHEKGRWIPVVEIPEPNT